MKHTIFALVLLLGACGHYSQDLASLDGKMTNPAQPAPYVTAYASNDLNAIETASGGPGVYYDSFEKILAEDYYKLARYENDHAMDYKAAQYYTKKAKDATMGKQVQPGNLRQFDVPDSEKPQLIQARAQLDTALQTQRSPYTDPMLAKAVVCYDCWLDQAEEGKTGAAATCADSFNNALANLAQAMPQEPAPAVMLQTSY